MNSTKAASLILAAALAVGSAGLLQASPSRLSFQPAATAPAPQPAGDPAESVGTLRNARVAHPMPPDPAARAKVTLTLLVGELTDDQEAQLRQVAPNVKVVRGLDRQSALAHAIEADAIDGRLTSPELLSKATNLTWIHSPSAGVERLVSMPGLADRQSLVLTNAKGVHGPAIADHAMGMLLALTRQLVHYEHAQANGVWDREEPRRRPVALAGRTMLVVGIGGIGTEIARRGQGFGMHVIATRRSDTPTPDFVEHVGKPEELRSLVAKADVIAVCVPLTKETEKLFDASMFSAVKKGAYLINIARGKVIDTDAMIAALKDGTLAGAGLDVTDPEPLPSGHALWTTPNVLITPHVAAEGELTDQRWWALFKENVRRFGAGEPLLNCVDMKAGY